MRNIVLASTSKRRKEIFSLLGIPFSTSPHQYDEENALSLPPSDLIQYLALKKADSIADAFHDSIIIGSDTLVINSGIVLPKPQDKTEAVHMLMSLSDTIHSIFTGYAIIDTSNDNKYVGVREAKITFRKISQEEAELYVVKEDVLGVAGAYDHEHLGAIFVESLEGDYFSSIGLPLYDIALHLKQDFSIECLS